MSIWGRPALPAPCLWIRAGVGVLPRPPRPDGSTVPASRGVGINVGQGQVGEADVAASVSADLADLMPHRAVGASVSVPDGLDGVRIPAPHGPPGGGDVGHRRVRQGLAGIGRREVLVLPAMRGADRLGLRWPPGPQHRQGVAVGRVVLAVVDGQLGGGDLAIGGQTSDLGGEPSGLDGLGLAGVAQHDHHGIVGGGHGGEHRVGVDVHALARRYSEAQLRELAAAKDRGFSALHLAEALEAIDRLDRGQFDVNDDTYQDIRAWAASWSEMIREREAARVRTLEPRPHAPDVGPDRGL